MIPAALLACALNVAPVTLEAVIGVESGGNPLALNVNGLAGPQPRAGTPDEAATIARRYIAAGYSVDIGLMQINSRNLRRSAPRSNRSSIAARTSAAAPPS